MKTLAKTFLFSLLTILFVATLSGCGSSSGPTSQTITLNPVLDFYINRTWNTDTDHLWGYGTDSAGNMTTGTTGSATGISGGIHYHNTHKLLYNFNISTLSGAHIQSASFRVYLNSYTGTDTPRNLVLENIFYGDTDSFPADPRSWENEFGGFVVSPAITSTPAMDPAAGYKTFDVATKLQADLSAGRTHSQFRLTHQNENSLLYFYCYWSMTDNGTNKPELVVTYTK